MPAPAVIPAPIAYIKVVAVKKLVVGFQAGVGSSCRGYRALAESKGLVGLGATSFTQKEALCP